MKTRPQNFRDTIKNRIEKLSEKRLKEVDRFLDLLDKENTKSEVLSFAGSWEFMDEEAFKDLTVDLLERRKTNRKKYSL